MITLVLLVLAVLLAVAGGGLIAYRFHQKFPHHFVIRRNIH